MAVLTNKNGTSEADDLTYDKPISGGYHAGTGNDVINITGGSITVALDAGINNVKVTGGEKHKITGGSGNDTLMVFDTNLIEATLGVGKDFVTLINSDGRYENGSLAAIRGGDWGDSFKVYAATGHYQLYGEKGDDSFDIYGGSYMNFWGGAGIDTFNVKGGFNNKLYGGDSADVFNIEAEEKQNLVLGYGSDKVNITKGNNHQIKANLGINTINLLAGSGHVITADVDKSLSLKRGYTEAQINAGQGIGYGADKVIISGASQVTANLGEGKDVIEVKSGSGHKLYTEGWGDTVKVYGGVKDSQIDLGDGDDTFEVSGTGVSGIKVNGGKGNDSFRIAGDAEIECYGGAGTDTFVVEGGSQVKLNGASGKDTYIFKKLTGGVYNIYDATNETAVIDLTNYKVGDFAVTRYANNLYLTYKKDDSQIIFRNWSGMNQVTVKFADNRTYNKAAFENWPPTEVTQLGVVQNFFQTLVADSVCNQASLDKAVGKASLGLFKDYQTLVDSFENSWENSGTSARNFLEEYCGIFLDNKDVGSITGSDAGGPVAKDAVSTIAEPAGMTVNNFVYDNSRTVSAYYWDPSSIMLKTKTLNAKKVNGITFYWNEEEWNKVGVNSSLIKQVIGGLTTTWLSAAMNAVEASFGMKFADNSSKLYKVSDGSRGIQLGFSYNENSSTLASLSASMVGDEVIERLNINMAYYKKPITDINGNPAEEGGLYLDRTLAHELAHGLMFANVEKVEKIPECMIEGMAELVHGIDDYRAEAIEYYLGSFYDKMRKACYTDTSTFAIHPDMRYSLGYEVLRFMAKQTYDYSLGNGNATFSTYQMEEPNKAFIISGNI